MSLNILVLCTGNSARSILGEAIFNRLGAGRVAAYSAGSNPTGAPNPVGLALLAAKGYDTGFARSKSWDEFSGDAAPKMHVVITVCDSAASETCPYWPRVGDAAPITTHWGLPDPAHETGPAADAAFAATYAALETRIKAALALPLEVMDRAEAQDRLDAIGRM